MTALIALLLALLLAPAAHAAFDVPLPVPKATFPSPSMQMPPGKIYIDTTTIPGKRYGQSVINIGVSCGPLTTTAYNGSELAGCAPVTAPDHKGGGPTGAFRVSCDISHYSFDDPIVFPRQSGMTHLHQFFGNTVTDAQHDASQMDTFGNSTCRGGIANRTGYWVPAFVYHCPAGEVGCTRSRDGEVQPSSYNDAYYKATASAVSSYKTTKWWPRGFRMIAGNPANTDPGQIPNGSRFDCFDAANNTYAFTNHLPNTADAQALPTTCIEIDMLVKFPECSIDDETILFTPAASGQVYSGHTRAQTSGCFETGFSKQHPTITYNIHVPISIPDLDYIRLSSDTPATSGVTRAGSTTTAVVLDLAEPSFSYDYYQYGFISINGQHRQIASYNGSTKIATLTSALSSAPAAGVTYLIRTAAGRSLHGDWANGWDPNPNFQGWGRSITDQIIRACAFDIVRYGDPAVGGSAASTLNLDCHNDLLGDPSPSTTPEPHIGGLYYQMY